MQIVEENKSHENEGGQHTGVDTTQANVQLQEQEQMANLVPFTLGTGLKQNKEFNIKLWISMLTKMAIQCHQDKLQIEFFHETLY